MELELATRAELEEHIEIRRVLGGSESLADVRAAVEVREDLSFRRSCRYG